MKFILSILLFLSSLNCLSQRVTDSTFYGNTDKLKSYGVYDTGNKCWRVYKFYPDGKLEQTEKLSPVTFLYNDTSFVNHPNGIIAWIFPWTDSGFLSGRLIGYYENGSVMKESYYYRQFRTGTWKEYYPNGKIKSISHYQISKEDSVFRRQLTDDDYQKGVAISESFSWGENDSLRISNTLFLGKTRIEFATLISTKTGVWEFYDSTGKLISRKKYKN